MNHNVLEVNATGNQKRRWFVPGSGKQPYTVVQMDPASTCTNLWWQCSCPAWTRHTPRTDCKHIIRVKVEMMTGQDAEVYKQMAALVKKGAPFTRVIDLTPKPPAPKPFVGVTGGRKFR